MTSVILHIVMRSSKFECLVYEMIRMIKGGLFEGFGVEDG